MGELEAARPHALVLCDLAEKPNAPRTFASNNFSVIASLSCLEGDWNTARKYSERGLAVSTANPVLLLPRVLSEFQTGEFAEGEVYLQTAHRCDVSGRARPDFRVYAGVYGYNRSCPHHRCHRPPGNCRGCRPVRPIRTVCYP